MIAAYRRAHSPSQVAWSEGRRLLGAVLHSSNEPSDLSQWPYGHDDSTINIVMGIIIVLLWVSGRNCSQTVPLYCLQCICIDIIWANKMMMMMMMMMECIQFHTRAVQCLVDVDIFLSGVSFFRMFN